jgi:hypothetical protein
MTNSAPRQQASPSLKHRRHYRRSGPQALRAPAARCTAPAAPPPPYPARSRDTARFRSHSLIQRRTYCRIRVVESCWPAPRSGGSHAKARAWRARTSSRVRSSLVRSGHAVVGAHEQSSACPVRPGRRGGPPLRHRWPAACPVPAGRSRARQFTKQGAGITDVEWVACPERDDAVAILRILHLVVQKQGGRKAGAQANVRAISPVRQRGRSPRCRGRDCWQSRSGPTRLCLVRPAPARLRGIRAPDRTGASPC